METTYERLTALEIARCVCNRKIKSIDDNYPTRKTSEEYDKWEARVKESLDNKNVWVKRLDLIDKELENLVENEYRGV